MAALMLGVILFNFLELIPFVSDPLYFFRNGPFVVALYYVAKDAYVVMWHFDEEAIPRVTNLFAAFLLAVFGYWMWNLGLTWKPTWSASFFVVAVFLVVKARKACNPVLQRIVFGQLKMNGSPELPMN